MELNSVQSPLLECKLYLLLILLMFTFIELPYQLWCRGMHIKRMSLMHCRNGWTPRMLLVINWTQRPRYRVENMISCIVISAIYLNVGHHSFLISFIIMMKFWLCYSCTMSVALKLTVGCILGIVFAKGKIRKSQPILMLPKVVWIKEISLGGVWCKSSSWGMLLYSASIQEGFPHGVLL